VRTAHNLKPPSHGWSSKPQRARSWRTSPRQPSSRNILILLVDDLGWGDELSMYQHMMSFKIYESAGAAHHG
jgi:hypothetical protein